MKTIHNVSPQEMVKAHHVRVYSTNGTGPLTHHLELVTEDGDPILFADGSPVRWSGRTYGQYLTNAGFMSQKYELPGVIDDSGIIRE